jgi:hypothetical protein
MKMEVNMAQFESQWINPGVILRTFSLYINARRGVVLVRKDTVVVHIGGVVGESQTRILCLNSFIKVRS